MSNDKFIRITDDLHGLYSDHNGNTILPYSKNTSRNTVHFSVNSVVADHSAGRHNYSKDGEFIGKIAIIANPQECPIPGGLWQNDTWFRIGKLDGNNEQYGINLGKATIVCPEGTTNLPENLNVLFYKGGEKERNEVIHQHLIEQGVEIQASDTHSWRNHSPHQAKEWAEKKAQEIYGENSKFIHKEPHNSSPDNKIEDDFFSIQNLIKDFQKQEKIEAFFGMEPVSFKEKINIRIQNAQENLKEILESNTSEYKERIQEAYSYHHQKITDFKDTTEKLHKERVYIKENMKKAVTAYEYGANLLAPMSSNGYFYVATPETKSQSEVQVLHINEILNKVASGELPKETMVWSNKLGNSWSKLENTVDVQAITKLQDSKIFQDTLKVIESQDKVFKSMQYFYQNTEELDELSKNAKNQNIEAPINLSTSFLKEQRKNQQEIANTNSHKLSI